MPWGQRVGGGRRAPERLPQRHRHGSRWPRWPQLQARAAGAVSAATCMTAVFPHAARQPDGHCYSGSQLAMARDADDIQVSARQHCVALSLFQGCHPKIRPEYRSSDLFPVIGRIGPAPVHNAAAMPLSDALMRSRTGCRVRRGKQWRSERSPSADTAPAQDRQGAASMSSRAAAMCNDTCEAPPPCACSRRGRWVCSLRRQR